jgi:hypothetical protein
MASTYKPDMHQQSADMQLLAEINAFAQKAHRVIQKARRQMAPTDRRVADDNANAILEKASAAARPSRRRA